MITPRRLGMLLGLIASGVMAMGASTARAGLIIDFYDGDTAFATLFTSNSTDFVLTLNTNNNSAAFVNDLSMAGPGGTFTDNSVDTVATAEYSASGFTNAGETYNWRISFPMANNDTRFTPGESALWSIVVTDPNAWNFNLIHINAFDGEGSIKLSGCLRGTCTVDIPQTPVPEPGTLLLLGAGLLGLALQRRRLGG